MPFSFRKLEPREMGTGGVTRTLLTLAIPSALAGVLATTYEAVDGLFISWLGKEQISGLGMSAPVLFMTFAIGAAISIGVAALVSRSLGEHKPDEARNTLNQALLIALATGSLLSVVGPLVAGPALRMLGAEGRVLEYGTLYLSRIMFGAVFMHVGIMAEAGLRAQGNTITGMKVNLLGNVANLVLDGFMIFGPANPARGVPDIWGLKHLADFYVAHGLDLGVQGGATATVLTRLLVVALLLATLCSRRSAVPALAPWRLRPHKFWLTAARLYRLGLPATVGIIGMAVSGALVNLILTQHMQVAVGVLSIASRLEMFAFVPIFSLGGAVVPMIGYNLGAGLHARCRRTVLVSCLMAGSLMGAVGAVLFAFPRPFLGLFTNEPDMLAMGTSYLRINSWSYFLIGCDIMLSNSFLGFGRAELSMLLQLTRSVIVKVPAAWLFSRAFGIIGVWYSFPISTIACFLLATSLMWWLLRDSNRIYAEPRCDRNRMAARKGDEAVPTERYGEEP